MERNYKDDIKIDANLENEWLEQPSLYLHYAELHADAIQQRDETKQELELEQAKLDEYYRDNWTKYSESRMTEAGVRAKILQDKRFHTVQKSLNKANHDVNVLLSAKTAFEHRKKALENLVSLLITGFHSEPKLKSAKQLEEKRIDKQKITKRIRKRKS